MKKGALVVISRDVRTHRGLIPRNTEGVFDFSDQNGAYLKIPDFGSLKFRDHEFEPLPNFTIVLGSFFERR